MNYTSYIRDGYRIVDVDSWFNYEYRLKMPEILLDCGFIANEVVTATVIDDDQFITRYTQKLTSESLCLKRFYWPYVPKWRRIKDLLHRSFK